jgi:hypothetical protein
MTDSVKQNQIAMKYLVWVVAAINVWIAIRWMINGSNYAVATTVIFIIILLLTAAGGIYVSHWMHKPGMGLLVAMGPWILIFIGAFLSLVFGKYP